MALYIHIYVYTHTHTHTYFDSRPLESNCPLSKYTISLYFRDTEINRLPPPLPTELFLSMEATYM